MISIEDIKLEYKRAILESQKLYADRRAKDTAGAVRYTKGKIVEDITKDIIKIAWSKISSDETRLRMDKKKIIIKTNDEVYKLSQDILFILMTYLGLALSVSLILRLLCISRRK